MIKIKLEDTYEPKYVRENLRYYIFDSEQKDGTVVELHVNIKERVDPLLPGVYNLGFGPLGPDGTINDKIKLKHRNTDKVFSSILLFALTFLNENPDIKIGIDGSNDARAYLYHRMFASNKDELADYFITIGVDWYVRLLRDNTVELNDNGIPYFKPRPEPFDTERKSTDLYRYYLLALNQ